MGAEQYTYLPAITAIDDCGDALTYSYTITGSTERSGITNDASGSFGIGISTITFTATDDLCGMHLGCAKQ
ncbi:MAG: hypothetical protein WKF59_15535 [Chitinophagaceae bacterium]